MRLSRYRASFPGAVLCLCLGLLVSSCGEPAKRRGTEEAVEAEPAAPSGGEPTQDFGRLGEGVSAEEKELRLGQAHTYQLERPPGSWLSIKLTTKEGDPQLVLADARGNEVLKVSEVWKNQDEWLAAPPSTDEEQRLTVSSASAVSRYRLELEHLPDPPDPLRQRAEAQRSAQAANDLIAASGDPELIDSHLQATAELWLELDEKARAAAVLEKLAGLPLGKTTDETIAILRRAVELRSGLKHKNAAAGGRNLWGLELLSLGHISEAREQFEAAREAFKENAYTTGIAASLNNLAMSHQSEGELGVAQQKYEEALQVLPAEPITAPKVQAQKALILENLARLHLVQGSTHRAVELLQKARELRKKSGDPQGLTVNGLALAWAEILEQDFEATLSTLEQLSPDSMSPFQQLVYFDRLATTYEKLGRDRDAEEAGRKASRLIHRENLWNVGIGTLVNQCRRGVQAGHADRLETCRQSVEKARPLADPNRLVSALYWWARALESEDRLEEAQAAVLEATAQLEGLRAGILGLSTRADYWENRVDVLWDSVALLMRLHGADPTRGFDRRAFLLSEQIRARGTLDRLRRTTEFSFEDVDPSLKPTYQGLTREIERLTRFLDSQEETDPAERLSRAAAADLQRRLQTQLSELDQLESEIRGDSRETAWLFPSGRLSLEDLRAILDSDTAVFSLLSGPKGCYAWVLTDEFFEGWTLALDDAPADRAKPWLSALSSRESDEVVFHLGRQLARELFGENDERLRRLDEKKRLLFVANGIFHQLPVSALPLSASSVEAPRYVVGRHEVVHVPSLMVALELKKRTRKPPPDELAVFGDTFYQEPSKFAAGGEVVPEHELQAHFPFDCPRGKIFRMPSGAEEVRNVARHFNPERSLIATGPLANKNRLLSTDLSDYAVIHLSSHGLSNLDHPGLSALLLSEVDSAGQVIERPSLKLLDLFRIQWPTELVVVSACESGVGRPSTEGLAGMASGFLFAGAQRVVASLWDVDNHATSTLMDQFYFELRRSGGAPSEALRAAKISLLDSSAEIRIGRSEPSWKSPRFWAAFVLIGEWESMEGAHFQLSD